MNSELGTSCKLAPAGVLHYLQCFDIFVADLIIDFVEASCILPISIIYPFCTEDIIAVFLIKCVNVC